MRLHEHQWQDSSCQHIFSFQALKSVALQQHTSEQGYSPDSSTPGQKGLGSRLSVIMQVYQWGEGT